MKHTLPVLASLIALSAAPSKARAFSDALLFPELTEAGGGGGRFFTGSPVDGFECSVCHQGGIAPKVSVWGLPDQYIPGTTYDIEVGWSDPQVPHALNLELIDPLGKSPGSVELLKPEEIGASSE